MAANFGQYMRGLGPGMRPPNFPPAPMHFMMSRNLVGSSSDTTSGRRSRAAQTQRRPGNVRPQRTEFTRVGQAVYNDNPQLLKEAIDDGLSVNSEETIVFSETKDVMSPLGMACVTESPHREELITLLGNAGADFDSPIYHWQYKLSSLGSSLNDFDVERDLSDPEETPMVTVLRMGKSEPLEALLNAGADPLFIFSNPGRQVKGNYILDHIEQLSRTCFMALLHAGGIVPDKFCPTLLNDQLMKLVRSQTLAPEALMLVLDRLQVWSRCSVLLRLYKECALAMSDGTDKDNYLAHLAILERENGRSYSSAPPPPQPPLIRVGRVFSADHNQCPLTRNLGIEEYGSTTMEDVCRKFYTEYYPPLEPYSLKKWCRYAIRKATGRRRLVHKITSLEPYLPEPLTQFLLYDNAAVL